MAREVYPTKEVIELSRAYVFMRVFADTDSEGAQLAKKFQVGAFPTLIILDSSGREADRIMGALSAPDLIEAIEIITGSGAIRI
jgi:thiol-disulfide isomerase/thioredoxin